VVKKIEDFGPELRAESLVERKILNKEKSKFLKAESRKIFRPIVPKVPATGGTITEFPST